MAAERRSWWSEARTCRKADGSPKAAFTSKRAAEKAAPATSRGLHAYPCERHGWHLGHG
jgi:hypothetical protein